MIFLFVAMCLVTQISSFPTDLFPHLLEIPPALTWSGLPWVGWPETEQKVGDEIKEKSDYADNYNTFTDGEQEQNTKDEIKSKEEMMISKEESKKDGTSDDVDNYNTVMEEEEEILANKTVALKGELDYFVEKLKQKLTLLKENLHEKEKKEEHLRKLLQSKNKGLIKHSIYDEIMLESLKQKKEDSITDMTFQNPEDHLPTKMAEFKNPSENIGMNHNVTVSLE